MKTRFNEERAAAAVTFIEKYCHHTKGRWAGAPFILDDWQRDRIINPLFGEERWSDDLGRWVRRYRKAYLELPKKSGKSELGAALALQGVFADGEGGPEVFSLAADKRQASLVFGVAADMVEMDQRLAAKATVSRSKIAHHGVIYVPHTRAVYSVLPGDVNTVDGINPSRAVLDELHRQPGRELYDMLDESFGARDEPLYIILTTAGYEDPANIAYQVGQYARQVRDGIIDDPYFLPVIYSLDKHEVEGDRWRDEELWRRVNPALSGFNAAGIDEMRRLATEAEGSPLKVAAFKRYRLNVWLPRAAGSQDGLIDIRLWDRTAGMTPQPVDGSPVYVGVDVAASDDIAAVVGVHPVEDCREKSCRRREEPCYGLTGRFWVPAAVLEDGSATWARDMREALQHWAADGWIDIVPGDVIDDPTIMAGITGYADKFEVRAIAKDPWGSKQIGIDLLDAGFNVYDHLQTMAAMNNPTDKFVGLVKDGRVHHGGHPVLRWMVSNAVGRTDVDGRIKPDKRRSVGKIDGVVAAIMGLSVALDEEAAPVPSVSFL